MNIVYLVLTSEKKEMNKIQVLGLVILILSVIGLYYTDGYGFILGILAGLSIGWLITGKFIVSSSKKGRL